MYSPAKRARLSVSLNEAVYAALPIGTRVMADPGWTGRPVTWAHALEGRTLSPSAVEQGELVIVPPPVATLLGRQPGLGGLLRVLAEREASACALFQEPTEELLAAAREASVPLLLIPPNALPSEVERSVLELLGDRERSLQRRADAVYERLLGMLVEEDGASAVARELRLATGKQVYVFDQYLRLLGSGDGSGSIEIETLREQLARPADGARSAATRTFPLRSDPGGSAAVAHSRGLELRGAPAGFVCLVAAEGEFGELDRLLTDRAASVLAIEVAKQRAVAEALFRMQGDFLDDLLEGSGRALDSVAARARSMGYDLKPPHLVFAMEVVPAENGSSATRARERFVDAAKTEVVRAVSGSLVRAREGRVDVVFPSPPKPQDAPRIVEQLRATLSSGCGVAVAAGIGRVAEGRDSIRVSYQQASLALAIARDLYGGKGSLRFEELGVERLLFHLVGNPELVTYRRDMIGALEDYDARHGAELTRTVEVFLACHGNHARAARELHLHRNTLLYRLERAAELLGKDLDDPETRLAVQLALRTRAIPGSTATSSAQELERPSRSPR